MLTSSRLQRCAEANADFQKLIRRDVITNTSCPASTNIPLGIVMWKSMAEALGWPSPIAFQRLVQLAENPRGWGSIGLPYGQLKFGHGNPVYSNGGRLAVLSMLYAFSNIANQVLTNATLDNASVQQKLEAMESKINHVRSASCEHGTRQTQFDFDIQT